MGDEICIRLKTIDYMRDYIKEVVPWVNVKDRGAYIEVCGTTRQLRGLVSNLMNIHIESEILASKLNEKIRKNVGD